MIGRLGERAIAHHMASWRQVAPGSLRPVLIREVRHGRQAHVQRSAIRAGLHGGYEGSAKPDWNWMAFIDMACSLADESALSVGR